MADVPEWMKGLTEDDKVKAIFDMYNGYVEDAISFAKENREGFEADNLLHLIAIRQEVLVGMTCRAMALLNILPDEFIAHMSGLYSLLGSVGKSDSNGLSTN